MVLEGHTDLVLSATFNLEGSLIVSSSCDRTIRIWDAYTGECLRVLKGHTDTVRSASFNYYGLMVISASRDGFIHILGTLNPVNV